MNELHEQLVDVDFALLAKFLQQPLEVLPPDLTIHRTDRRPCPRIVIRDNPPLGIRLFTDDRMGRWRSLALMSEPSIIDRSVEKAHIWLNDLAEQLGTNDHRQAYRVLRAYLHALRDRLPVDEAAQLAAQLPELIRGIYYEGWNPSSTPVRYRDLADFLDRISADAGLDGETAASYAVSAAAAVLRRHVSAGEIEDVRATLPEELRPILD